MNVAELERKVMAVARAHPPGDQVPYAFEKRVMARISSRKGALDVWGIWGKALWRAAAPCVAITILLSVWSYFTPGSAPSAGDLSQDFENAVLAAADSEIPAENTW
jgi:hypothetical protein